MTVGNGRSFNYVTARDLPQKFPSVSTNMMLVECTLPLKFAHYFSGLSVMVDKRITLGAFKDELEQYVGVTANNFKVCYH